MLNTNKKSNLLCIYHQLLDTLLTKYLRWPLKNIASVCKETNKVKRISPSRSSAPNTIPRAPDTPTQCISESRRRLKLMNAGSTPTLASPSHRATVGGRLSMKMATTSPDAQPCARAHCATAFDRRSSSEKLHTSPVDSSIRAGLSGWSATCWANMDGTVLRVRI